MHHLRLALLAAALSAGMSTSTPVRAAGVPATLQVAHQGATAVGERCEAAKAAITAAKAALEARTGPATLGDDFVAYDRLAAKGSEEYGQFYLVFQTHPDAGVREAAGACVQAITELDTALRLSRPIYDRLAAVPAAGLDAKTAFLLDKTLREYRLAGVDKDQATREKVASLTNEIGEIGLRFAANIREDKGDVAFAPDELAGLPADYLEARKPADDGRIHLTFDYPDVFPVLDFAERRATRQKMATAYANRGWPANEEVLKSLLRKRHELATTLGFPDYATLITSDKMIGNPQRVADFLAEIDAATTPGADAYLEALTAFARREDPDLERLQRWDTGYFGNRLKKSRYNVDAEEVRQYFSYDKAEAGIFRLMGDLFGADIRPWDSPVWHPDVSAWSLYDGQRLVGHFYLDTHPRAGKFNHAAVFPLQAGIARTQAPIAALVTNFPAAGPMDHRDFVTFLHEFGHLVHWLYAGNQAYGLQNMGGLQWDFIEAPSQLLEEWAWDYDTLKTFASNEKGEPIPRRLVDDMNAGRWLGEALVAKRQLGLAAVSLNYYNRAPDFDLSAMYDEQMARYTPIPNIPGTHPYASFGHLDGYSAIYYTYGWSKAIALDLFTAFQQAGLRDREVAMRYRTGILEAGASQGADELVDAFLGRPWNLEAFRERLLQQ